MYSASGVDKEFSDWNLELQRMGTFLNVNSTLDLLFTLTGSILSYVVYKPAKAASAYISILRFSQYGVMMIPFV